jgi:heme o synthase
LSGEKVIEFFRFIVIRIRAYLSLVKSLQTGLLIFTGLAGFMSARCPVTGWLTFLTLAGSLFLAIGGSTVLNMVYDRDIDERMTRTCRRPLPAHVVKPKEGLILGIVMVTLGVGWSFWLNPLYGLLVFIGMFSNLVIYTLWLKRRTAWSFLGGGIAGAMPILAGRALGTGQVDLIGLLLAAMIMFWIPTHIVTFSIKYAADYQRAGVPVLANVYGERMAGVVISVSSGITALAMVLAAWFIGLGWGYFYAVLALSVILLLFAVAAMRRNSYRMNFALFKLASVYMLAVTSMMIFGL